MENGEITKYDYGFEEYLETLRAAEKNISKSISEEKPAEQKEKAKSRPAKPEKRISVETLITEAEAELAAVNAEIEFELSKSAFMKMKELYEKKSGIEEKIELLYGELF